MKRNGNSNFYDLHSALPTGMVVPFAGKSPPEGFLICDGAEVSRVDYSRLFEVIGTAYGIGDGSLTFRIPDLRGRFVRGNSGDSTEDTDRGSRSAMTGGTFSILNGSTNIGSSAVTVSSTENISVGMTVQGTGIPVGSYVRSVTSSTEFELGNNLNSVSFTASVTGTTTLTFGMSASANYPGSYQAASGGSLNLSLQTHFTTFGPNLENPSAQNVAVGGSISGNTRPANLQMDYIIKV